MAAGYDFKSGTFQGSVFAGCSFAAAPPPWGFEAGRLAEANRRLAEMPGGEVPEPGELPLESWLPHAWNPNFVGREAELREVAAALRGAGAAAALCPSVGLQGLGGVGKSQLAVEFAHRYGRWFAGGRVLAGLRGARRHRRAGRAAGGRGGAGGAGALRGDAAGGAVRDGVAAVAQRDAAAAGVRQLRGRRAAGRSAAEAGWVPGAGDQPAERVLGGVWAAAGAGAGAAADGESAAAGGVRPDLAGPAELEAIAEELGDLPLALHLAGSFLRENRFDDEGEPERYLAALRAKGLDHASLVGALGASGVVDVLPTRHDRNVARTFAVSWDRLDPAVPVDALAWQALACAACFAPRVPVPRDLLARAVRGLVGDEAVPVGAALMRLLALGLVAEEPSGGVSLHRLVAVFATARAGDPESARDACGVALRDVLFQARAC
jgi:hypothetical protein